MTDEVAAIVRWLRERSRMAQNRENVRKNSGDSDKDSGPAPHCAEADYAKQFADEIERQFGHDHAMETMLRKNVPLDGVIIDPKPTPRRRSRR